MPKGRVCAGVAVPIRPHVATDRPCIVAPAPRPLGRGSMVPPWHAVRRSAGAQLSDHHLSRKQRRGVGKQADMIGFFVRLGLLTAARTFRIAATVFVDCGCPRQSIPQNVQPMIDYSLGVKGPTGSTQRGRPGQVSCIKADCHTSSWITFGQSFLPSIPRGVAAREPHTTLSTFNN